MKLTVGLWENDRKWGTCKGQAIYIIIIVTLKLAIEFGLDHDIAHSLAIKRWLPGIEVVPAPLWKLLMVAFGASRVVEEILSCDLLLLNPNVCIYIYIQTYNIYIYIYTCVYIYIYIYIYIYNQNMSMIKKNYRSGPSSILKCSLRQWMDIFCKAARSLFLEGFGRGLVQFLE